ncbi:chlorophyll synthesis pathway protein BchC [uncultured Enterovirga sp.]|uniref:chlorophyll synthesis pathway protein BchC n=1 Tax=uncultured Enterovirga sp. TaxID=2026352 RepID=UPI0035C94C50
MDSQAVVMEGPGRLGVACLPLTDPVGSDIVVDVAWSGISTGTERLLHTGTMPAFPGMGYPLVPGYESVGRVVDAGSGSGRRLGETVFVPGARCFGPVRGLFGGSASRLVVPGARVIPIDAEAAQDGVLLALAATAYHAIADGPRQPDLIVGHGVLGRLLARIAVLNGAEPTVWERNPERALGAEGYQVTHADEDPRRDYNTVYDVSGDPRILDALVLRLAPGGEIVLAGFYAEPLSFAFAPAFMREPRIRVAAQWRETDLAAVRGLVESGRLSLAGLVTHESAAAEAPVAYRTAFDDPACLKMVLDWSRA